MKKIKIIALFLTVVFLFSNFTTALAYAAPEVKEAIESAEFEREVKLTQDTLANVNAEKMFADGTVIRLKNAKSGKYLELMDRNLVQNTSNTVSYKQRFALKFNEEKQAYTISPMNMNRSYFAGFSVSNAGILDLDPPPEFCYWNIYEVEGGKIKILSDYNAKLSLATYGMGNGSATGNTLTSDGNAIVNNYIADESQHWYFEIMESSQYFQDNAVYTLKNASSSKYLTIAGNKDAVGQNVIQSAKTTGDNQKFRFEYDKNSGHYIIRSKISTNGYGNVIGKNSSGQNVQLESNNYTTNDRWLFTPVSNGRYKISLYSNPNMVLTTYGTGNGTTTGTSVTSAGNVFVSAFTGATNQLWTVDKVALPDRIALPDTKAASFTNNKITQVQNESQLTKTMEGLYFDYYKNTRGASCGFLVEKNGKKEWLTYSFNFYQGELNVGGSRTILGKEELPEEGYKVVCFKLEENCNTNVLMTPNAHYAGKTVLSYGLLDESTNKVTYFQQELECNFDEMYENARKIPTPAPATTLTATNEASTYSTADISSLRSMEVDYMVLMQSTPTKYQLDDGSDSNSRSADSYPGIYKTVSVDDPVEPCPMDNNNEMRLGNFLDYMINNGGYNTNIPLSNAPDDIFISGPLWQFVSWNNFATSNSPYLYFAYAMSTSVPGIKLTQILVLDLRYTHSGDDLSFQVEITHTGLVAYNSLTGQMEYDNGRSGAGQIDIISAVSYFNSLDSEGAFYYRYYDSYRSGWTISTSNLIKSVIGLASYALNSNIIGELATIPEEVERQDMKEGKPYYHYQTKQQQQNANNGKYMATIEADWGQDNDYFYHKEDYWLLETKKNNMSKWLVGFDITARMYVYMRF